VPVPRDPIKERRWAPAWIFTRRWGLWGHHLRATGS